MGTVICKRVRFSGRVQGVGFRYTAHSLALHHAVTGFVRNLPSGDVELVAEGDAAVVEGYLKALGQQMAGYIEEQTVQEDSPGGYRGFVIRG